MSVPAYKTCTLACVLLALTGCSEPSAAAGEVSGATCPTGSKLSYESFGRSFMQSYCTRCHSSTLKGSARNGAPSDHDFDSLAAIQATESAHLDQEAAAGPNWVNTDMPPDAPSPTTAERRDFGEWVACGTP